jgi:hypothetical protein
LSAGSEYVFHLHIEPVSGGANLSFQVLPPSQNAGRLIESFFPFEKMAHTSTSVYPFRYSLSDVSTISDEVHCSAPVGSASFVHPLQRMTVPIVK